MRLPGGCALSLCCAAGLLALPAAVASRAAEPAASPPHQDLTLSLDPRTRELVVEAVMTLRAGGTASLALGTQFEVSELKVDGQAADRAITRNAGRQVWALKFGEIPANHRIELRYRGRLAPLPAADHRGVLGGLPAMADEGGSFLPASSGWHPEIGSDAFTYRLRLELPAGQRGIAPGMVIGEETSAEKVRVEFRSEHPIDGIDLMAGPYRVRERLLALPDGAKVRLRTYFHAEIDSLAPGYLDSSAGYVERYAASIAPYPYAGFSVVSGPLPTGLGMPALTYMGIDVLRLPFIRATSLGHEVLHNWWGNGVYVDWERGNWSEGLTSFMADYAFKEDEGEAAAREMRLGWLRDYAAVSAERDQPLRAFTSRTHDASQIVGYNKAAFVFFMLRDELGRPAFDSGIRRFWADQRFRRASWEDLQLAFEQESGRKLDAFFAQWLARKGAPELKVEQAAVEPAGQRFRVRVILKQAEPAYRLRVPLMVTTETGREEKLVEIASPRQEFALEFESRPRSLAIDPDLRLFRRLDATEIPLILRQITLDPRTVTLLASRSDEFEQTARTLAQRLLDTEPRFAGQLPPDAPALVIGLEQDVDALLTGIGLPTRPAAVERKGSAQVWTAARPDGNSVLVVSSRDLASLQALLRPLPHYGRQSWLVFDGAKAVERGVWPSESVAWRFD